MAFGGILRPHAREAGIPPDEFGQLLDSVRGIRWNVRRPVRSRMPGAHASRMRGTSSEFTEYRPYRQGDYIGRIDWKLFGRTDRAFIRLSTDRAVIPTMVIVDGTASMAFPEPGLDKWRTAASIAVALAAVARNAGDPAGFTIAASGGSIQVRPRTRAGVIREMIQSVGEIRPAGSQPLAPVLEAALRSADRIAVVSDFLGDSDDLLALAREAAASAHDIHAIHVVARAELDPSSESLLVSDPEDPSLRRPLAGDARARYVDAFRSWGATLEDNWVTSGISFTRVVTGAEPVTDAVRRITR